MIGKHINSLPLLSFKLLNLLFLIIRIKNKNKNKKNEENGGLPTSICFLGANIANITGNKLCSESQLFFYYFFLFIYYCSFGK